MCCLGRFTSVGQFNEKIEINLLNIISIALVAIGLMVFVILRSVEFGPSSGELTISRSGLFLPEISLPIFLFVIFFLSGKLLVIVRAFPNYAVFDGEKLTLLNKYSISAKEVDKNSIKIEGHGPKFVTFEKTQGDLVRFPGIFCRQSSSEIYQILNVWVEKYGDTT